MFYIIQVPSTRSGFSHSLSRFCLFISVLSKLGVEGVGHFVTGYPNRNRVPVVTTPDNPPHHAPNTHIVQPQANSTPTDVFDFYTNDKKRNQEHGFLQANMYISTYIFTTTSPPCLVADNPHQVSITFTAKLVIFGHSSSVKI